MKTLFFIFIFTISSCAVKNDNRFRRVKVDSYNRQSGVIKYFLPSTKSFQGERNNQLCIRDNGLKPLDISSVMKSFDLNFLNSLHLQYSFNVKLQNAIDYIEKYPTLKEEEQIFFQAMDEVRSGQYIFKAPKYQRVNVIWVDSFIYQNEIKKLKKILSSNVMNLGRPLLFSICLSRLQLKSKIKSLGLKDGGSRFLSSEILSKFNKKGVKQDEEFFDFNLIKKPHQEYHFYYTGKKPTNVLGKIKYIKK